MRRIGISREAGDEAERKPLISRARPKRSRTISSTKAKRISPAPGLKSSLSYRKPTTLSFKDDAASVVSSSTAIDEAFEIPQPQTWTGAAHKVIEGWVERGQKPTIRQRLAFYVDTSRIGRFWDLLDTVLNLFLVLIYLYNTRYARPENKEQLLPFKLFIIEWCLAFSLFIQWLPRIYVSADILDYIITPFSLISLIATLPPILVPVVDYLSDGLDLSKTYMAAGVMVYVYPFRFVRLHLSFCKLLLPVKNPLFHLSTIVKKTLHLCSTILFTITFVSAWIHIVTYKLHESNKNIKSVTFFDAFFFTTISSTSGFNSNLVPDTDFNRLVILFIMISGALFLPGKIGELLSLIQKRSPFGRSFVPEGNQQHVIVCGKFDNNSIFEFLREFFCEDHGLQTMNTVVVILNSNEPSEELINILNDPVYSNRVQYVKGLPTSYRSLEKAKARKAKACFVLTDKFSPGDDREGDATAVMLALVLLPENKPHFDYLSRQIICIQELRLGMLAQNVLNPGFSTMIYLLATSITNATCDELTRSIDLSPELKWLDEYILGATHEIYPIKFSAIFVGMRFSTVVEIIYRYFGVTLFAVNLPIVDSSGRTIKRNIVLNPVSYKIKGGETGYIMSCSAYDANRISRLGEAGNTFQEYKCIYEEEVPKYFPEGPAVVEEPSSSSPLISLSNSSVTQNPIKESMESDVTERIKRTQVLQSDGLSSEEGSAAPSPLLAPASSSSNTNAAPGLDLSNTTEPILSVQERNINHVISEMMKENSYFTALSAINNLTGHVVICDCSSTFPRAMEYFVGSLRASHLTEQLPIVILSISAPSDSQRYLLEQFGDVHFLEGSPLSRKALFAAGVSHARKGVVLCDENYSGEETDRTVDASSLLIVLNMESMALDPDFFVIVEFVYRENMKLMGAGETIPASETYAQALLRPSFMAGHVVAPCMLEPMICQAYYNEDFLAVIDRLIFDASLDKWRRSGGVGSGGAYTPSRGPNPDKEEDIPLSHIFTFNVPSAFDGRPYCHLFSWLLKEKSAVPLGIYRTRVYKSRQISYVITNPKPDCQLMELDKSILGIGGLLLALTYSYFREIK